MKLDNAVSGEIAVTFLLLGLWLVTQTSKVNKLLTAAASCIIRSSISK